METHQKEVKCVVWDLDNTLWNGTLLESDMVTLKPEIPEILMQLDSRGILHSISSKNHHADAMAKLREFRLDQCFLYPEIHWNAKSTSIANIQKNLNIGMDSLLFIDDDRFEREEVQSVHQHIHCMDAVEYTSLPAHPRLNPRFVTEDSKKRRMMYLQDLQRQHEEDDFTGPAEHFLASLNMTFMISEATESDLQRVEELTARTNQLNSTGYTYSYQELDAFRTSEHHKLYVCELIDKFGTYGKIGVAVVETSAQFWHLKLLLMSCRVMSRGVGTILLSFIMQQARAQGKELLADFARTDRNKMMYVTYKFANFKEFSSNGGGVTILKNDVSRIQPFPQYIHVTTPDGDGYEAA